MTQEIKCSGGCDTVLGSVELGNGEFYKGDTYYGMYCESCPLPEKSESELDLLKKQMQEILDNKNI